MTSPRFPLHDVAYDDGDAFYPFGRPGFCSNCTELDEACGCCNDCGEHADDCTCEAEVGHADVA